MSSSPNKADFPSRTSDPEASLLFADACGDARRETGRRRCRLQRRWTPTIGDEAAAIIG